MQILIAFIALLPFSYLSAQEDAPDCARFRTGKFVVYSKEYGDTYIDRTEEFQIEKSIHPETGSKIKLKSRIVWSDECTYQMFPFETKDPTGIIGDEVLTFQIIETGPNYYVVYVTGIEDFETEVKVFVDPKE